MTFGYKTPDFIELESLGILLDDVPVHGLREDALGDSPTMKFKDERGSR